MSRFPFAIPAFTLATLLACGSAFAQQTVVHPNAQVQPQPPINQPGQRVITQQPGQPVITQQPGQPVINQPGRQISGQPITNQPNQGGQYNTQQSTQQSTQGANAQRMTVKDALVQKLRMANDAEIELANMAQDKTDNEELKQFAQMLVADHQKMNQKLQSLSQQGQQDKQGQGGQNRGDNQARNNQPGQQGRGNQMGNQMVSMPPQLTRVMETAHQNALSMTKEMLQEKEGKDFQMAFLGQQCVAHTMQLAALKAIESEGPEELQPVAQEAITKVQSHLDKAKQLAENLKDKGSK